jgi:hypothetical protein
MKSFQGPRTREKLSASQKLARRCGPGFGSERAGGARVGRPTGSRLARSHNRHYGTRSQKLNDCKGLVEQPVRVRWRHVLGMLRLELEHSSA